MLSLSTDQKVTIGIPTYNRLSLLEMMSASLYRSDLNISHNLRIYDDCSSDFGKDFLEKKFPTAKSIKTNNENLGPDKNMYQMYVDFLSTGDDFFFNADSDLIFNKQWLNNAIEMIKKTDGVLSLFNTNAQKPYKIIDDFFCLKHVLGAAGTFFTRDRISELLDFFDSYNKVSAFDWQWSKYFTDKNINLYCVNESLVQHIGYIGKHATILFPVGKGFKIGTIEDGQIVNDIYSRYIDDISCKIADIHRTYKQKLKKIRKRDDSFFYHLSRCIRFFLKRLFPKCLKKIICNNATGKKKR